jgi:hypothetical protein
MWPMMPLIGKVSNFFVLGLPRSRTAWLANFLTYDNHFCFHEAMNGCRSIDEYKEKLAYNGDSNTGMMLFNMNALFPDSPKVIIERDPKYAIDYCYKTYGSYDPQLIYVLKEGLDKIDGLRIRYDDIDNRLQEIWEYLIGDGYNKQRANLLKKLNIQVQDPHDIDIEAASKLLNAV